MSHARTYKLIIYPIPHLFKACNITKPNTRKQKKNSLSSVGELVMTSQEQPRKEDEKEGVVENKDVSAADAGQVLHIYKYIHQEN